MNLRALSVHVVTVAGVTDLSPNAQGSNLSAVPVLAEPTAEDCRTVSYSKGEARESTMKCSAVSNPKAQSDSRGGGTSSNNVHSDSFVSLMDPYFTNEAGKRGRHAADTGPAPVRSRFWAQRGLGERLKNV